MSPTGTSVEQIMSSHRTVRCIVKLGGSAVTEKEDFETLNEPLLSATAKQLQEALGLSSAKQLNMDWSLRNGTQPDVLLPRDLSLDSSPDMLSFVVVHGAGSFGHFQASKGRVNVGPLASHFVKAGFVATRISITKLNHEVVRAFASEGIPAVGVSPFCAGWSTSNRNLEHENTSDVERFLDAGLLPVLHGDAVLDSAQGCNILSGDIIVRQLAQVLVPSYVVFLTNVAGIFDRPPSDPGAILLKEIVIEDGSWRIIDPPSLVDAKVQTSVAAHDTTGGIETKIAEAASIAAYGITVLIVQAGSSHALEALKGTPLQDSGEWVGTLIRKARPGELSQ